MKRQEDIIALLQDKKTKCPICQNNKWGVETGGYVRMSLCDDGYYPKNGECLQIGSLKPTNKIAICGDGTIEKNGQCVPESKNKSSKSGGCLIATATYGSELAPQVQQLRELRDNALLNTELGTSFMNSFNNVYYSFSPYIADYERQNPVFKEIVKLAITPMISSLSILNYVDINSEVEVLGYGISLILLNVGMYVGIPAIMIIGIKKQAKLKNPI